MKILVDLVNQYKYTCVEPLVSTSVYTLQDYRFDPLTREGKEQ